MKLEHMAWPEVDARLRRGAAIMLPTGSTEQHGPMGRIGTDTLCADAVANRAADLCDAIVAPPLSYTPAPFNTAFPGTVSVSSPVFTALADEVIRALLAQGFSGVFVINGHGANLDPLRELAAALPDGAIDIRSWWDPPEVSALRRDLYGDWEGMHATPSEIAITQCLLGALPTGAAADPPRQLSAQYLRAHAGDRHGPPDAHRAAFPDGRVGSHSALASPGDGARLLDLAARALAHRFRTFQSDRAQPPDNK